MCFKTRQASNRNYIVYEAKYWHPWFRQSCSESRTTDTKWRHKSELSEILGRCGRLNMLWPYLKILDCHWIFGCAVKAISSLGVRSPCSELKVHIIYFHALWHSTYHNVTHTKWQIVWYCSKLWGLFNPQSKTFHSLAS
jgi:hypothetical protein